MDVLTDMLQRSRAHGAAFSHSTAHGEWGVRFPRGAKLAIHGILGGEAFAWTDRPDDARRVLSGDVVLVRGPSQHHMAHAPAAGTVPFDGHPAAGTVRRRAPDGRSGRVPAIRRRSSAVPTGSRATSAAACSPGCRT